MNRSAAGLDLFTHAFDDGREFVAPDVGMGIDQDGRRGSKLTEKLQYPFYVAPLFTAGVELAIGKSTGTTFAKTVVGVWIDQPLTRDGGDVLAAIVHRFAPFNDDGFKA